MSHVAVGLRDQSRVAETSLQVRRETQAKVQIAATGLTSASRGESSPSPAAADLNTVYRMPTQEDFAAAATGLRTNGAELGGLERRLRNIDGDVGVEGDTDLARTLDQGVAASYLNLNLLGDEMDRLAVVMDDRAGEAAEYTRVMKLWRRSHQTWKAEHGAWVVANFNSLPLPHPGPEPSEPPRVPYYVLESRPGSLT